MKEEQKKIAALQLAAIIIAPVLLIEFKAEKIDNFEDLLTKAAEIFRPIIDRYLEP